MESSIYLWHRQQWKSRSEVTENITPSSDSAWGRHGEDRGLQWSMHTSWPMCLAHFGLCPLNRWSKVCLWSRKILQAVCSLKVGGGKQGSWRGWRV
jgi:hypothetical protein